jgi:hypothetical protein
MEVTGSPELLAFRLVAREPTPDATVIGQDHRLTR